MGQLRKKVTFGIPMLEKPNQCIINGCCRLPRVMDEALGAFLAALDRHTVAGIALRPKDFRRVLAPDGERDGMGSKG